MSIKLTRISADDYKKDGNTTQDNLTNDDINILLEEYAEVDEITELKPGIHVRYFNIITKKNSEQKIFRMGGTIIKIDYDKKYMVLSNGKISWSVQINNTNIFYRKMTTQEVKDFYENELNNMEEDVKKYKSIIDKFKIKQKELITENDHLKTELINIKKILKKANIS
jgi:hypothetical protein